MWDSHFGKIYARVTDYPVLQWTLILAWFFGVIMIPMGIVTAGTVPTVMFKWIFGRSEGPLISVMSLPSVTIAVAFIISFAFVFMWNILRCITCNSIDCFCLVCCGDRRRKKKKKPT